jgi:hypothetical protein
MPTDWEHGTRVYLYTEEDPAFARLPVFVRAFAGELLKFGGRIGVLHVGAENAIDVVCRRVGAHAGERRQIRQFIPMLIKHEYLVEVPGALVIRNFLVVHYGRDSARLAAMEKLRTEAIARARLEYESGTTEQRTRTERSTSRARAKNESATSGERVSNESATKPDVTPPNDTTPSGVPSGPFLPSGPIQSTASGARAGAPDPVVAVVPVVQCSTVDRPNAVNWADAMIEMRGWSDGKLKVGGPTARALGEAIESLAKVHGRGAMDLARLLAEFAKADGFAWMKVRRADAEWLLEDDAKNLTTSADRAVEWDANGRQPIAPWQAPPRADPKKGMQPPAPSSSFDDANRAGKAVVRDPFGELQFPKTAGEKR